MTVPFTHLSQSPSSGGHTLGFFLFNPLGLSQGPTSSTVFAPRLQAKSGQFVLRQGFGFIASFE